MSFLTQVRAPTVHDQNVFVGKLQSHGIQLSSYILSSEGNRDVSNDLFIYVYLKLSHLVCCPGMINVRPT